MATPEAVTTAPIVLYNEAYVTRFGVKQIELAGKPVVVHETNNLRDLIDAYFRETRGILPRNFGDQVASAKLAEPAVHFTLQVFMRLNPELREQLEIISQQREAEYETRREIRARIERGVPLSPALISVGPSEKEEAFRDFIYSQVLDYIGDLETRYGLGLDLSRLAE